MKQKFDLNINHDQSMSKMDEAMGISSERSKLLKTEAARVCFDYFVGDKFKVNVNGEPKDSKALALKAMASFCETLEELAYAMYILGYTIEKTVDKFGRDDDNAEPKSGMIVVDKNGLTDEDCANLIEKGVPEDVVSYVRKHVDQMKKNKDAAKGN